MKLIKEAKENFDGMTIEEIFWKVAGHKFPVFKKDGTLTKQAEHLYGKAAKAYGEDAFDKLCADEHCFKESLKEDVDEQKKLEDMIAYYTKQLETMKGEDAEYIKGFVEYLKKQLDEIKNGDNSLKEATTPEQRARRRGKLTTPYDTTYTLTLKNKYNYTIIQYRVNEKDKTIEKGLFNWGDGKGSFFNNRKELQRHIDDLLAQGYKMVEKQEESLDGDVEAKAKQLVDAYYDNKLSLDMLHHKLAKLFGSVAEAAKWFADYDRKRKGLPMQEAKKLTERRWNSVIKAGIELRNALSADKTDVERVREAIIACYDELYDKGLIDDYDHDEWVEEVRDCDFESEWGIDEDAIDYELDELYDLCDNIGAFLAVTEADLDESLSQEIGQAYKDLNKTYGVDVDKLVAEFMKAKYPKGFPDFKGDVIYSEKYWDEFVDWAKKEKGVDLSKKEDNKTATFDESCKGKKCRKPVRESIMSPNEAFPIDSKTSFYLGDICYALKDEIYDDVWGKQYKYADGSFDVQDTGLKFAVVGTAFGDGEYDSKSGFSYPVDAGVIGIVPVELCDEKKLERVRSLDLGRVIDKPGYIEIEIDDEGTIFIYCNGRIIEKIYTGDNKYYESANKSLKTRKNKKALKEDTNENGNLTIDLNTGVVRFIDAGQYNSWIELPDEAYWEDDDEKTSHNNKEWDRWILECAKPYIEECLDETSPEIKLVGELKYYHPKYYNYSTDEIEFTVSLTQDLLNSLVDEYLNKPEFIQFLKSSYKSYDGYWSWMADNAKDFMEQADWKKLASILSFNSKDGFDKRQESFAYEVLEGVGSGRADLILHWDDDEDMDESLKEDAKAPKALVKVGPALPRNWVIAKFGNKFALMSSREFDKAKEDPEKWFGEMMIELFPSKKELIKAFKREPAYKSIFDGIEVNESLKESKQASYTVGGYEGKDDPMAKKDIRKASLYDVDADMEQLDDGSWELVITGDVDKVKDYVDNYLGLDSTGLGESLKEDVESYIDIEDLMNKTNSKLLYNELNRDKASIVTKNGMWWIESRGLSNRAYEILEREMKRLHPELKKLPVNESLKEDNNRKVLYWVVTYENQKGKECERHFYDESEAERFYEKTKTSLEMYPVFFDEMKESLKEDKKLNDAWQWAGTQDETKYARVFVDGKHDKVAFVSKTLADLGLLKDCRAYRDEKDKYIFIELNGTHNSIDRFIEIMSRNGMLNGASEDPNGYAHWDERDYKMLHGLPLDEDTVKQGNNWVNKGKEGTHGKFKTKKAADAQRKAMFANGYKENLKESKLPSFPFDSLSYEEQQLAEYLFDRYTRFDGRHDSYIYVDLPDAKELFDEVHEYYDDRITRKQINKVMKALQVDADVELYEGYLQLSDAPVLDMINVDVPESEGEWFNQFYFECANDWLEKFEKENGVSVSAEGRSGRHIVVDATAENFINYKELKDRYETLMYDFIGFIEGMEFGDTLKEDVSEEILKTPRGDFKIYKGTWRDFKNEADYDDWGFWFDHSIPEDAAYSDLEKWYKIMHNHKNNNAIAVLYKDFTNKGLKEGYFDTDFNSKKVRNEIVGWWNDVERWNEENGSPYSIDNGDTTNLTAEDVEDMLVAMFDMLLELKDADKDLYKRGRRIYNKYALEQIRESKNLKESKDDMDVDAWVLDKIAYMNAPLATVAYGFDSSSWEDDMETRLVGGDTKPLELVVAKWDDPDHPNRMIKLKSYPIKKGMTMGELEAQLKGDKEPIKESKEEDLTADEIAYKKYQDGEYTYQDYVDVCTQEECEPLPEIKESIEEISDTEIFDILGIEEANRDGAKGLLPQFRELAKDFDKNSIWLKADHPTYTDGNKVVKETDDLVVVEALTEAKEEPVEEKKETAKDRVLAKRAMKEAACKEPENKPEGNWAWDKDACDWYDKDTDTFHSETIKEEVVEESIDPETYVEDMEGFDDIDFLEESIFDAPIITDLFGDYDC